MDSALDGLTFKDRKFPESEIELIVEVVDSCGGLSRQELANTVCELLEWRRPNGGLKTWECRELLERLQGEGLLRLPAGRRTKPVGASGEIPRRGGKWRESLEAPLERLGPVILREVEGRADGELWRELVGSCHYRGGQMVFGARLRYLIEVGGGERVVGALQLSSPAWRMASRDGWIGWDEAARRRNLQRVVSQSRFLILPWVRVPHLASHVLGKMARQFPARWRQRYGALPLLLETLVEERFEGTSYRAANWLCVGATQGRGRMDRGHERHGASVKKIFVYPLRPGARRRLCQA